MVPVWSIDRALVPDVESVSQSVFTPPLGVPSADTRCCTASSTTYGMFPAISCVATTPIATIALSTRMVLCGTFYSMHGGSIEQRAAASGFHRSSLFELLAVPRNVSSCSC